MAGQRQPGGAGEPAEHAPAGGHGPVDVFARAARGLRALEPDAAKLAKYVQFIDIYAALTENEQETYQRRYPEKSKAMAGMIQRAHDRGMRQGRVQMLEQQLTRRFGPLAPAVSDRLHQGSATDLEAWAGSLLDARTVDDVFDSDAREPGR